MENLAFVRVTGGDQYEYLKDIDIFGRIDEEGDFIVFGCRDEDQLKFYQGLLDMDRADPFQGWETVEDVKEFWENPDMLMYVEKGNFKIVKGPCEKLGDLFA